MAMSPFAGDDDDGLMNEINMTPLVDVMLVLLIVFMVTIPVIRHAVKIDLPHASSQKEDTKPAQVTVSIDADGNVTVGRAESRRSRAEREDCSGRASEPATGTASGCGPQGPVRESGASDVGGAGRRPHEDRLRHAAES